MFCCFFIHILWICLDQSKKALVVAQEDYVKQNSALMEDMPKLYEGRIDYFQPSFQALINSQVIDLLILKYL